MQSQLDKWIRNPLTAGQMGGVWKRNESSNKHHHRTSQNTQKKFEQGSTTQIPDRSWSKFTTNENRNLKIKQKMYAKHVSLSSRNFNHFNKITIKMFLCKTYSLTFHF